MKTASTYLIAVAFAILSVIAPAEAGKRKLSLDGTVVSAGYHNAGQNKRKLRREIRRQQRVNQGGQQAIIPPSVALRRALRYSPGSQGLGVRLLNRARPVYAVKVKSGNRIMRILIDARTGQQVGR